MNCKLMMTAVVDSAGARGLAGLPKKSDHILLDLSVERTKPLRIFPCVYFHQPLIIRYLVAAASKKSLLWLMQIDCLLLQGPPEPLDEDIVQITTAPVHGDFDLSVGQPSDFKALWRHIQASKGFYPLN